MLSSGGVLRETTCCRFEIAWAATAIGSTVSSRKARRVPLAPGSSPENDVCRRRRTARRGLRPCRPRTSRAGDSRPRHRRRRGHRPRRARPHHPAAAPRRAGRGSEPRPGAPRAARRASGRPRATSPCAHRVPHACIAPSVWDANSTPLSSWIGSASMSARSASVWPCRPPRNRATTLVGVGHSISRPPNDASVSRMKRAVSCSRNESSG